MKREIASLRLALLVLQFAFPDVDFWHDLDNFLSPLFNDSTLTLLFEAATEQLTMNIRAKIEKVINKSRNCSCVIY